MELRDKNILLVSPEPWNHIFVSKHHYAVYLAGRGNRVFFLNPPGTSCSVSPTEFENVFSVGYKGFVRGLKYFPGVVRKKLQREVYAKVESLCNCKFDIIWSFDNSVFFDFDALPDHLLAISHIVDLNQDFQTARAAASAGICFCTTDLIQERLKQFNPNVVKINHGVHLPAMMPTPDIHGQGHAKDHRVKAVYSGNLAMPYIDWVALEKIVSRNPGVDFIFLGPGADRGVGDSLMDRAKRATFASANVSSPGVVVHEALQSHYLPADILLIAYQEAYHAEQANPHKMMEYLASGNVVVSSFTAEYKKQADEGLIAMSEGNADLPEAFSKTVGNLNEYNREELRQARRRFATENSYTRQIDRIEELLTRR